MQTDAVRAGSRLVVGEFYRTRHQDHEPVCLIPRSGDDRSSREELSAGLHEKLQVGPGEERSNGEAAICPIPSIYYTL